MEIVSGPKRATHGDTYSKEHRCWATIKRRCYNLRCSKYKYYGGRGITVCDRWLRSYENFLEDMGRAPSPDHSIDRINNDGNYEPLNCQWATMQEQNNNRRCSRYLTHDNQTRTLSEWSRFTGINSKTLHKRLKNGWSVEKAITTPRERKL